MSLQLVYLITGFISARDYAFATKHCPVLSLDFSSFGIEDCTPSFSIKTPDNIKDFLENAKCKGYGQWDIPSVFGCKSPPMTEGIEIDFPCGCDFGAECHVKCDHKYELIGSDTILCQENGSYTEMPRCEKKKCHHPKLSPATKLAYNCKSEEGDNCTIICATPDYRMYGPPFIVCDHSQWSQIPVCRQFCRVSQIPSSLKVKDSCEGNENEFCEVSCRNAVLTLNGLNVIQCLPGGKWSSFPTCGCSADDLPHGVHVEEDCKMVANEYCDANCGHHGNYPKGNNQRMFCNSEGKWDLTNPSTIDCWKECDPPSLPDGVVFTVPCDSAQVGQECQVKCQDRRMRLTGSDKFHCLRTGKYSGIPACTLKEQCSRSLVSPTVKMSDDCAAVIGEECPVSCKNPKAVLQGPPFIKCLESGSWNTAVECVVFCPPFPDVSEYQPLNCQQIRENSDCDVTCKPGYTPTNARHVYCLEGGKWPDELPKCVVNCGFPSLNTGVTLKEECTHDVNDICKLLCGPGFTLIPRNLTEIKCLPNGKWTDGPECRQACSPRLPHRVKLLESCPRPLVDSEECEVQCRNPEFTLLGDKKLKCINTKMLGKSGRLPRCEEPCPTLSNPPSHLIFEDRECKKVIPGRSCRVKCRDSRKVLKGRFLCRLGPVWSKIPECVFKCPLKAIVPLRTYVAGDCPQTGPCLVKCFSPTAAFFPGSTLNNIVKEFSMKCIDGVWENVPMCNEYCSEPSPIDNSNLRDDCEPEVGTYCAIVCAPNHRREGESMIHCTSSGWRMSYTIRCVKTCGIPSFVNHPYMQLARSCSNRAFICYIKCNPPTYLIGDNEMACEHRSGIPTTWQIRATCAFT